MKMINFMKKNNYNILLPTLAITSFFTWYFKFDFVINIYIYVGILLILTVLRQSTSSMMLVVLFSVFATYSNELHLLYQLLFVYVVIYFIATNLNRFTKGKGNLFWPLTIITTISALSMLWSPSKIDALAEFLVLIQGTVTYFVIVNDEEGSVITPINIAWMASFLLLVLGSQYFLLTYQYFPKAPDKGHLAALWLNPNIVAAALGLLWIPSLYKYEYIKEHKYVLFYLPFELLTIYAIYMSMSRGLYFGYIVAALIFVLMMFKIRIKTLTKIFFIFIASFITFILLVIIFKDILPGVFSSINEFSTSRFAIYDLAFSRIKRPLTFIFGDGIGSAAFYINAFGGGSFYYHSWFFQILTTRGIFSLILQVTLMFKIFSMLDNDQKYSKYIMLGFIVYLSHSLIDIGYEYQFLGIIYYLVVGTVERKNTKMMYNSSMIEMTS